MAKAAKKKEEKQPASKKKELPLKVDMSFEELLKLAATTPIKKKDKK